MRVLVYAIYLYIYKYMCIYINYNVECISYCWMQMKTFAELC